MANINLNDPTEKRISLVYNSELSGFQALDFSKIDGIETLLNAFTVTGENIPSGITVYQANLNKDLDNASVYVSGEALDYLSSLVTGGISLKGINTVNVNVTGGSLNVINEVEIKNQENNPVPVSGTVTANVFGLTNSEENIIPIPIAVEGAQVGGKGFEILVPDAFNTYRSLSNSFPLPISGTVTAKTEKSSTISNSAPGSSNGTALNANANRLELFIQNLQSGNLYVKYGASANSNSFNLVLASSTVSGGGDGGSLSDLNYTGIVSVSGLNSSYICWERS